MKYLLVLICIVFIPNLSNADPRKISGQFIQISDKQNFFSLNVGANDNLKVDNNADFYVDDVFRFKAVVRKTTASASAWKIIEQNNKVNLNLKDNLSFVLVDSELDGLSLMGDIGSNHSKIPMFSKPLDYSNVKKLFSK
jgi:hypothetical protein